MKKKPEGQTVKNFATFNQIFPRKALQLVPINRSADTVNYWHKKKKEADRIVLPYERVGSERKEGETKKRRVRD